tara:strand:+ start:256 stop:1500 length:1245 start_codon:yes stop_codon:yes gene_type:complete
MLLDCANSNKIIPHPFGKLVWHDEFDKKYINQNDWTFDLGTGAPVFEQYGTSSTIFIPENFPKDNFTVRWTGKIKIHHSSDYTFYIVSDDGVRLFIDKNLVIDKWIPQPATESSGKIYLEGNRSYEITLEYFEKSGGEALIFGWKSKRFDKCLVPNENLLSEKNQPGLTGRYFPNESFKSSSDKEIIVRTDSVLNWVTSGGWGNNELQYYTDSNDNVRIENGKLIVEAKNQFYKGSEYTSSRIKTRKSWKYGRFEISARLPIGRGTWAAGWALPTNWEYGPWPFSGEIDIFEHVGHEQDLIVSSVHNIAHSGDVSRSDQQGKSYLKNACNSFNLYALEWEKDKIKIFVNDRLHLEYNKNNQGWERWPFDQPFHLLFNIAVGGSWGGLKGVDNNVFPSTMEIDYIRVYQKINNAN